MAWPVERDDVGNYKAMKYERCKAEQRSESWFFVLPRSAVQKLDLEVGHHVIRHKREEKGEDEADTVIKIRVCRGLHITIRDIALRHTEPVRTRPTTPRAESCAETRGNTVLKERYAKEIGLVSSWSVILASCCHCQRGLLA